MAMSESSGGERRGMALHTKILLGLVLGAVAGVVSNALWSDAPALAWIVDNLAQPVGQVFLRMLFMVVVPLVFTSLTLGVAGIGDVRRIGRIGGKTLGIFVFTTTFAVTIGLTLANVMRPGSSLDPEVRSALLEAYAGEAAEKVGAAEASGFGINTFVNIVPRNPLDAAASGDMLGLIFFTIVFGIALTQLPENLSKPVLRVIEGIGEAVSIMIGFAMKLAPVGVAGLIFAVTARFGFDVLGSLGLYAVMVLCGLALHQFIVLPTLARTLVGVPPLEFLRRLRAVMVTAFSTSSSNATLPTTIRTAQEEFGVPRQVAGFVIPLGATMNMNGTALFEGVTVVFLSQVFGPELTLGQQAIVVVLAVLTAIGAAGVPGGSIPLLAMVLRAVGVEPGGIALIIGVDRLLDMCRTTLNVVGDIAAAAYVARSEGFAIGPESQPGVPGDEAVPPG